jgi:hypothetical protein
MLKKRSVTPSSKDKVQQILVEKSQQAESSSRKTSNMSTSDSVNNNNGNLSHWNERVEETLLAAQDPDQLYFQLVGGADEGQFPHVGQVHLRPEEVQVDVRGHGLNVGDVLLEIQGQKVGGYTGHDVTAWLRHCLGNGNMVVIRAVPKGKTTYKIEPSTMYYSV